MSYEEILKQLEAYRHDLADERRLVRAGHKSAPDYNVIQARFSGLFAQEQIHAVKEALGHMLNAKDRERMERTLFALVEGNLAERTMPIEQDIAAAKQKLNATVDGDKIGFFEFSGRIANEPDFAKREQLRTAYVALTAELVPQQQERERVMRQALLAFGFHSVREYVETRKHIKHETLLKKAVPILEDTTGLYRRVMGDALRKDYGKDLGDLSAAHVSHWRSGHEFDHLFPADKLIPNVKAAFATMGLDLDRFPQIQLDTETRAKKRPRAWHLAARTPQEIHLLVSPRGGYDDLRTLMHEAGHAIAIAATDPALPYEHRELPRSHAMADAAAFVAEHLTGNPLWLEHVLKIPKAAAERVASWAVLANLFRLRRTIAKFTYELAFDERPSDTVRNKALYAKTLRDLTGFAYEPDLWMEEYEPLLDSADFLRASIASAQIEEHLNRAMGDRWFLKRETGEFMKKLYAHGAAWEAEDLTQSLGMQPWDPLPLIRTFDSVSKLLR